MSDRSGLSRKVFDMLELKATSDLVSRVFNVSLLILISLNVVAVILETIESLAEQYAKLFWYFEVVSIVVFSLEIVLRLWTCTSNPKYRNPVSGRLRYLLSPMALVDLLAVLPFYLPLLIPFDLRFFRALRLLRLFRLFKVGRYTDALRTIGRVVTEKREELYRSFCGIDPFGLFVQSDVLCRTRSPA